MFAAEWGTGQVVWSLLWITMAAMWIALVIMVFARIIRSQDLSGLAKAAWLLFVIVLPFFGVFAYLVARGDMSGMYSSANGPDQGYPGYV